MNLPNKISMVRIFLIPVFFVIFLLDKYIPHAGLIGTAIFAIAAFTDFVDGYIARKYNMVTTLGKYLDSIADKLLVAAALVLVPIYIIPLGESVVNDVLGTISTAFVFIIIAREFLISALRQVAAASNIILAADNFGRVKAAVQDVALIILLPARDLKDLFNLSIDIFLYIGFALLAVATLLTILSAVHYFYKNKRLLKEDKQTRRPSDYEASEVEE